jgi:hypothetical protein
VLPDPDGKAKRSSSGTDVKSTARRFAWRATKSTADTATRLSTSTAKFAAEKLKKRSDEN